MAISPSVAKGMKKWVSRKQVEIGPEELKVQSGTLLEGSECYDSKLGARLYSCPLGYLPCLVGEEENEAAPLIDSGSQLNIILDALANKLNITPRVNFSSAVYGINNQACELIGVAEDVPIKVGKNISGTCHFWITQLDSPLILGRPFLIDFDATLLYSAQGGERIVLPDLMGRNIEVCLCTQDSGWWERQFPAQGRKAVLTHMGRIREEPECAKHFL
ncbi:hypothetical protein PSTG_11755 [Puccinia striiformis f. sp. tritici PST-78]|uniref:Peptidase A2 domain-containing protein n=2 Tax=Puccinia striiformis f. sp. tritici TaxID=168172 RepID=A0A0L0V6B4_9BASI|nr:hypothetical protein PSTG_11755 [Puccinia striiformis f. sp. tritici PST-78]